MKIKTFLLILITIVVTVSFNVAITAQEEEISPRQALVRDLSEAVEELAQKTELPLRFPSYLEAYATEKGEVNLQEQVQFISIGDVTPTSYMVYFDNSEDCNGTTACKSATVMAELVDSDMQSLNDFAQDQQDILEQSNAEVPEHVKRLELGSRGELEGYFVPSVCYAYCTDAKIIFDLEEIRYTVAEKAGSPEAIVKAANSLIVDPITSGDF